VNQYPEIELRDITVIYEHQSVSEVTALRSVSLAVMPGEIAVLIGHNGSGKSTVLKALAGTAPVVSGTVRIRGADVSRWPASQRAHLLGLVHQDPMMGTCPNLTVHENVRLYASRPWWWPLPEFGMRQNTEVFLSANQHLPLSSKTHAPIKTLSGGQRQGLALALALSSSRSILLMDEFSSSLDNKVRETCIQAIAHASRKRNLTVLAVTHDLASFAPLGPRVIRLSEGAVMTDQ
jgi:putative tryptophan/tyrosine transport system ATP-binding protein